MAQESKPPPDQQERLYAAIGRELIALTPESWHAAVLEVSVETGSGGMGHTIVSPEGNRQPIMPSDELMQSTYELLTLFRQYGREWKRMTFTLELRPEGEWHYVCHFVYD